MALIAGTIDTTTGEFEQTDSLALRMDNALPNKPEFGKLERRQLLVAIAKGILSYLEDHQDEVIATIKLQRVGSSIKRTYSVLELDLDIKV